MRFGFFGVGAGEKWIVRMGDQFVPWGSQSADLWLTEFFGGGRGASGGVGAAAPGAALTSQVIRTEELRSQVWV